MGAGRFDPSAYAAYSSTTVGKSTDEVFKSRHMKTLLDPKGVLMRESRDSTDNPESTPVIVGLDVTGSMGMIADTMARTGLGVLFKEILDRKPVSDPHIMFAGIGDANCDRAPFQVSQFEADSRIIEQLADLYIERGGGGNNFESYNLPWYFAAHHTSIDCFEKRGKKGYLFTVGDEEFPKDLTPQQIETVFGDQVKVGITNAELLAAAQRMYHVFHVVVEEGSHARSNLDRVLTGWSANLGQRVLRLSNHTKLSEVIVSAIQITEGADVDTVAKSWGGDTSVVVANATRTLSAAKAGAAGAVVRF